MMIVSKLKGLAASVGLYFLYLFGSCVVIMLVEALFSFLLDKLIVVDYFPLTVIRIVIYTVGVTALMGLFGYAEGYREMACPVGETAAAYGLAVIPHLLFAMLFKFQSFVSGSVRFTAGLIHNGTDITYDSLINQTPYWLFLVIFAAYALLYGLALVVCKYFGAQKRIIFRAELRRHEQE